MSAPLLEVTGVTRTYRLPRTQILGPAPTLTAVEAASFTLSKGETLGIVGESGSGKSTLARLVMGFEFPDAGQVRFDGDDIFALPRPDLRFLRRRFQMIFQDPFASLDPRRRVGWSIAEPLRALGRVDAETRYAKVAEALSQVGLDADHAQRFPHEFSGGQRQRIAIARSIVTRPDMLVADEAVSALDVSVRAQILNLLMDIQAQMGLAMLFISHDLPVVAALCDRVLVMRGGHIVEQGPVAEVFTRPKEAYTAALLAASEPEGMAL